MGTKVSDLGDSPVQETNPVAALSAVRAGSSAAVTRAAPGGNKMAARQSAFPTTKLRGQGTTRITERVLRSGARAARGVQGLDDLVMLID